MLVTAIDTGLDASLTASGRERPREATSAAVASDPEAAASRGVQQGLYILRTNSIPTLQFVLPAVLLELNWCCYCDNISSGGR